MKYLLTLFLLLLSNISVIAANNTVNTVFTVTIPSYTKITPMTDTVLTANMMKERVLNPLHVRYKVVTNEQKVTLYLTAKSLVDGGYEHSMFENGTQKYIAFTSINGSSLQNLTEAKYNLKASNVLVLPVLNVIGAEYRFIQNKYELYVKNGISFIDLHVGLFPPIKGNKDGVYQATVYLTEVEI